MSNPFGVPPPPPGMFDAGRTAVATRPDDAPATPTAPTDTERWRRRGALTLAFFAIGLLVFANLAVWLNFSAFSTSRANAVANATFDTTAAPMIVALDATVVDQVKAAATRALGPNATVEEAKIADVNQRVDQAVRNAVLSDSFRAQWRQSVRTATERQKAIGDGAPQTQAEAAGTLVTVNPRELGPAITTTLVNNGYSFMGGVKLSLPPYSIETTDSAANHRGAIALGNLWLLFLLGAIVLGAGALYLADRRLRFATIMAIDAAVMLIVCLLLVPLIRQVVDDQAVDSAQAPWLLKAYDAEINSLITQTLVLVVIAACIAVGLGLLTRSRRQREDLEAAA